jgi:hypothetical protein
VKINDYDMQVGIGFEAVGQTAVAVEFVFVLQDASDKLSTWYSGSTMGTFSPGVTISPRHAALNNSFITRSAYPENTAWEIFFSDSMSYAGVRCVVYKALEDCPLWTNPVVMRLENLARPWRFGRPISTAAGKRKRYRDCKNRNDKVSDSGHVADGRADAVFMGLQ